MSTAAVFCSLEGTVCGGAGTCKDFGCSCLDKEAGHYCTGDNADSKSVGTQAAYFDSVLLATVTVVVMATLAYDWRIVGFRVFTEI